MCYQLLGVSQLLTESAEYHQGLLKKGAEAVPGLNGQGFGLEKRVLSTEFVPERVHHTPLRGYLLHLPATKQTEAMRAG
jgi:hypothetical protein